MTAEIFEFERDFADSLRCVPMAVRLKLDLCGVKLSLRQWSRFTTQDRLNLLQVPCDESNEVDAFNENLRGLIDLRCDEPVKILSEDISAAAWRDEPSVPRVITDYARSIGIAPPTDRQWHGLSQLKRFALFKLTRDKHENINFLPALHEFGLVGRSAEPA